MPESGAYASASSSCQTVLVPPNLPGTPGKAPNWRQSLPVSLGSLADAPRWLALPQIFRKRQHQG